MDGRRHTVIEVGGKIYNLRVSYNALCLIRRTFGDLANLRKDFPEEAARAMIWAGINGYGNQNITIEQAGDICEDIIAKSGFEGLQKIMKDLDEADWLEKVGKDLKWGTDTGNQPPIPEISKISSGSTSTSPMASETSPPESSGV